MADDIFPRDGDGFCADVESGEHKLKLFSSFMGKRWAAAVYDLNTNSWVKQEISADDAEDGKRKVEEFAAAIRGVKLTLPLEWYPCPKW